MTLQEFEQLDYPQRVSTLQQAVFIGKREGRNYTALLYQLDSFYMEALQHRKYQFIYQVEGFDDVERLNPYLNGLENLPT